MHLIFCHSIICPQKIWIFFPKNSQIDWTSHYFSHWKEWIRQTKPGSPYMTHSRLCLTVFQVMSCLPVRPVGSSGPSSSLSSSSAEPSLSSFPFSVTFSDSTHSLLLFLIFFIWCFCCLFNIILLFDLFHTYRTRSITTENIHTSQML